MWGFKWLNRDKNHHKKLLKLAADIIKFVEEDKAKERLQAKLQGELPEEPKTKEEITILHKEAILPPKESGIWDVDFGRDKLVEGNYSDFWSRHTIIEGTIKVL